MPESVVAFFLAGWLVGAARVFTATAVATCLVAVTAAEAPPAGGGGLYGNLVLFRGVPAANDARAEPLVAPPRRRTISRP